MWLANLTLTQIYVPLTLTGGLTQMWSLSVEVSFYLALPIFALLARRLPVRARVPAIAALGAASWAWAWVPIHAGFGINPLNWPPAFFSWFAAGMLLAELVHSPVGLAAPAGPPTAADGRSSRCWPIWWRRRRWRVRRAGPGHGSAQFAVKIGDGRGGGAARWWRRWCWTGPTHRTGCWAALRMVTLGRWSYGLFIWHLAALAMVFPVIGTFPFTGRMPTVLVLTLIFGFAIAAVSYALVESPCREALRRWEKRERPSDSVGSVGNDAEADAVAP